jgi:hypothetical protein
MRETGPVGVPPAPLTLTLNVTVLPWVMVDGENEVIVTVDAVKPAVDHFLTRFATFTEPKPVAVSYPVDAFHAGVVPPALVARKPYSLAAELVLLQSGESPKHATELFPVTTS